MPNTNWTNDIINHFFGSKEKDAHIAPITTGRFNESFQVKLSNGKKVVLRIAPPDDAGFVFYEKNMMAQEPAIHAIVKEKTDIPIPEILFCDSTRRITDRDYLIMSMMEGVPFSNTGQHSAKVLKQVGEYLSQLHAVFADNYGYLGAHHPMDPQGNWGAAFSIMWEKMIAGIVECGGYSKEEADYFMDLYQRFNKIFDRGVKSSLLHMDIWHENILVDESGNVTGLIDWDRALWGDPEIEYAVLDYCGISTPSFWTGYGKQRDLSSSAQSRRVFYLLYEIQKYIIIRRLRGKDPALADRYRIMAHDLANSLK